MIERQPFGAAGFESSRVLFGAAAFAFMRPDRVEQTCELLTRFGVNHIDVAASYGEAELRLAPWLSHVREEVFLATKTRDRDGAGARASLERSLERMGVSHVDLIQLHNLVDEPGWAEAMGPGGAVEALVQAQQEGLVRHLGVTGHGTYAPSMHLRSLDAHPFASVLCPLNYSMWQDPVYRADFERLRSRCQRDGVALQTIKSIARRRWADPKAPHFSWYEPLQEVRAIEQAVHWVLSHDGVFLNSSSDARLLEATLRAASQAIVRPTDDAMQADQAAHGVEPLFVRDLSDAI